MSNIERDLANAEEYGARELARAEARADALAEALHKIDGLSDYDETNEWVDVYGLMEDIGNICRELKEAGTL